MVIAANCGQVMDRISIDLPQWCDLCMLIRKRSQYVVSLFYSTRMGRAERSNARSGMSCFWIDNGMSSSQSVVLSRIAYVPSWQGCGPLVPFKIGTACSLDAAGGQAPGFMHWLQLSGEGVRLARGSTREQSVFSKQPLPLFLSFFMRVESIAYGCLEVNDAFLLAGTLERHRFHSVVSRIHSMRDFAATPSL